MRAGGTSGARHTARRKPLAWVALLTTASAASCTPSRSAGPLPEGPPVVKVTLREYGFDYAPPASPGRVVFEVANAGMLEHDLALQPLPDDLPPIDEQLRGPQRRVAVPFAGVPAVPPGGRGTFAVDLAPGRRYALICFVVDPDGTTHGVKGMNAEFRTGEGTPPSPGASPRPPP